MQSSLLSNAQVALGVSPHGSGVGRTAITLSLTVWAVAGTAGAAAVEVDRLAPGAEDTAAAVVEVAVVDVAVVAVMVEAVAVTVASAEAVEAVEVVVNTNRRTRWLPESTTRSAPAESRAMPAGRSNWSRLAPVPPMPATMVPELAPGAHTITRWLPASVT
mmetsp:Transcript_22089/g.69225  ORF Transcript_22089/g.69225 Transcript_22089/m.69225 type:complete len:161 (-) Transcript_22089:797-1279(-)